MQLTLEDQEKVTFYLGYKSMGLLAKSQLETELSAWKYDRILASMQEIEETELVLRQMYQDAEALELDDLKIDSFRSIIALRARLGELVQDISTLMEIPVAFNRYVPRQNGAMYY